MIYLDNAATTQLSPQVLDAMMPYLKEEYGNAGSIYDLGKRASSAIEEAREKVADFMGVSSDQIIFTSGGTEANNLAILGARTYLRNVDKGRIVTSPTEHASVLKAVDALCETAPDNFFKKSFFSVDERGAVPMIEITDGILDYCDDVGLISLMYINNELGTDNYVETIGDICRENDVLFHTDCVQAAGSFALDSAAKSCDFMSIASHKIHGPKGVGALYVRDKRYLYPIINGGSTQEFGLRGGTENVAGIVGFGEACRIASEKLNENIKITSSHKKTFHEVLEIGLLKYGLRDIMRTNGPRLWSEGKILSFTFDGVDAETLVLLMNTRGVCISAGSACQSHESKPSHVLKAIGLSDDEARSTVRVSFSEFNTEQEVRDAAEIMAECVKMLRAGECDFGRA